MKKNLLATKSNIKKAITTALLNSDLLYKYNDKIRTKVKTEINICRFTGEGWGSHLEVKSMCEFRNGYFPDNAPTITEVTFQLYDSERPHDTSGGGSYSGPNFEIVDFKVFNHDSVAGRTPWDFEYVALARDMINKIEKEFKNFVTKDGQKYKFYIN